MKNDVKIIAKSLGLRTNNRQKSIFDDVKSIKSKPKMYNEREFITQFRIARNIVLLNLYPQLNELINQDGTLK